MARVHTEGTLQHQGIRDESEEAERDFPIARNLALAGRLTGDERYTKAAAKIVSAWLSTYHPDFNPIDETIFDELLVAYDLLEPDAKAPLVGPMQLFLRTLANGYFDRMETLRGGTATNNWQSHRIKLVTMAAFELADPNLIRKARQAYAKQLEANLRPDGTNIDFEERDALHYVTYDLEPLEMAALVAKQHGEDWYHMTAPNGATVGKTIDWLVPYAEGTKTHEEFVHSKVKFDYARRDAGQPGFSGPFDPQNARETIALAARLDRKYAPLARKMGETDPLLTLLFPLGD